MDPLLKEERQRSFMYVAYKMVDGNLLSRSPTLQ